MKHRYIAIEGPIGVGKTTLAGRLAESLEFEYVSDTEGNNPYLERFYKQQRQYALHTQLHFLLTRVELLQGVNPLEKPFVTDFTIDKDRLFAELTLDDTELWMYTQVHGREQAVGPKPDLVIYLQAPVEILIKRIEKRGLRFEQRMDSSYLQKLVDSYETFFHNYVATPLLVINASEINLADNDRDYENLLRHIKEINAGRHFLNPIAEIS